MKVPKTPFSTRLSGSAKETELRVRSIFQWKKKRPPVAVLLLAAMIVLLCFGLFSCKAQQEETEKTNPGGAPGIEETLGLLQTDSNEVREEAPVQPTATPEPEPTPEPDVETDVYTLENLNLDGSGENDDSLTMTVVRRREWGGGEVSLNVRLGAGQELQQEIVEGKYYCESIHAAYLTSMEYQTVVIELAPWGANWPGAHDILLEVKDGTIVQVCSLNGVDERESLSAQSVLYGLELVDREDSPLQALRIPTSVGKWHGPDIGTLTWEDGQWQFVLDGYYTDDWHAAVVDGGVELTISLRGRINRETPSYLIWYYDQIQILHGDTVIQTITEDSFTPDDHCRFDFFNADVPNKSVHVRDINFDGNDDFAVSCNRYHNDGYCWFLYDPQLRQFRYAFSLSGQPTLDLEQKQIVETWQDDYGENITYNTYEYDEQGELTLVESRKETQ